MPAKRGHIGGRRVAKNSSTRLCGDYHARNCFVQRFPKSGIVVLTTHAAVGPGEVLLLGTDDIHSTEVVGQAATYHLHLYGRPLSALSSFQARCFSRASTKTRPEQHQETSWYKVHLACRKRLISSSVSSNTCAASRRSLVRPLTPRSSSSMHCSSNPW